MIAISPKTLDVVTIVDPAISEKVTAARTAVLTVGLDPKHRIFLLAIFAARVNPSVLIDTALEQATKHQSRVIGIEDVAYQRSLGHFMEKQMKENNHYFPIRLLKPDKREKKEARIRGRLHGYLKARQFYCQAGDFDFLKELEEFPMGRTCDILDALAYAPEMWSIPEASSKPELERDLEILAQRDPESARYWRSFHQSKGKIEKPEEEEDFAQEEALYGGIGELFH